MTGVLQTLIGGFGAAAAAVTDAYFYLVTLLLPGNGTNGAQNNTFLDSSTNNFTITRNGNTTQGTFSPFSQTGWSNYFDGTGDYLSCPSSSLLAFGTGSFCVEFWLYRTGTTGGIFSNAVNSGGGDAQFEIQLNGTNKVVLLGWNTTFMTGATTINANTWYHIAVVRSGSSMAIFVNGARDATATSSNNFSSTNAFIIGAQAGGVGTTLGYISNLRAVKGSAIYNPADSTITVPTSPLTTTSQGATASEVELLTCQGNRFVDISDNAFAITVNGNPSVQAFSPFAPTAAYSAATVGGSGYFDGTGDYLNVASNTALTFGTGDFTVEGWFYANALGGQPTILNNGSDAGGLVITMLSSKIYAYFVGAGNVFGSSGATIVTNTWYHFAWVRSGSTNTFYLNGAVYGATYSSAGNHASTGGVGIGYSVAGTAFAAWNGYIADVRMVKGTAVYTTAFTPPTAPLTAITNTSLLANFTNAGITDATAKNDLETVGNAQISTTQSKFGGSSMYFDGTGDYLTSYNVGGLFRLGTVYTVEMWFYTTTVGAGNAGLINFATTISGNTGFNLYRSSAEIICNDGATGGTGPSSGASSVSANTWTHLAVVSNGTTTKLYLDGVEKGSYTGTTGSANSMTYVTIGSFNDKGSPFSGYIDDLRVTRGYARYTASFTPPTTAFPLQ